MKKHLQSLALMSLLSSLLLVGAPSAFAQNAQLTGRVADQGGGVVVGATVTVTNIGTKIQTAAVTNDEGLYTIPLLPPGDYEVDVKAAGFRPVKRSGVKLDVQQVARVDIALEAGQISDSVNITAGAQLTEPDTSSLGQVIENKRINELPLNGRNPLELARLTPNVNLQATAFNDSRNFNIVSMSINGGPPGTNAILLDGSSATLPERNEYSVSPNVDAVQEFKVQTNSYSAEFGLTGGGVINLVTKSGTNDFTGSLFEFARNDAFDANRWDFNRRNLSKAKLRYHQFGGAIGGPLWLPKKVFGPAGYDGRNRSFFFFNYSPASTSDARRTRPI
ncbi:MAG: carboxypeptidase regulatory-like domain-containing protein [Blastocatellia bacterium]